MECENFTFPTMNIAELLKELFDSYKERLKNPIFGSFLISTVLWNWRPLSILIFSGWSMDARVDYVSDCYLKGYWYWLGPMLVTFTYLVILPHILWGLDLLLRWSKEGRKTIYQKGEEKDVEHDLKIQDMRARTKELRELNDIIENLKAEINAKVEEIDLLKRTIVSSENEKSELVRENEAAMKLLEENFKSSQKEIEVLNNGIILLTKFPKPWKEILEFNITGPDSYREVRSRVDEDLEIAYLPDEIIDTLIGFYKYYLDLVNIKR